MARTKAVAIKNPSNSSSLESEFVHSPSHRTLDKGKDKAIYISSEFDSEATMTLTPPHAKDIVIDSPRKICSMKLEKSENKRMKRSKHEIPTLCSDKALRRSLTKAGFRRKWSMGDTLISLR